jgi:hypothetical protein
MGFQLQRLMQVNPNPCYRKEWVSMRPTNGVPYEWATEAEALDNIRFWNDGSATREEFRTLLTRDAYMKDSRNLHQTYYLQIARMAGLRANNLPVSIERIREALKTDQHLNNIPLRLWDLKASHVAGAVMRAERKCGDTAPAPLDGVCALKALAKHLATEG